MATNFGEQLMEHRLNLSTLARELHEDGRLSAQELARVGKSSIVRVHPLVFLAEQKLPDAAASGQVLDMDTCWPGWEAA